MTMARAVAQTPEAPEPREQIPAEDYDGFDVDAFNERVSRYRAVTAEHGFDASLSLYCGEPTVVVHQSRKAL